LSRANVLLWLRALPGGVASRAGRFVAARLVDALCACERSLVMLKDMGRILKECIKSPGRTSIWSQQLNKYVCTDSDEGRLTLALAAEANSKEQVKHPPIDPKFKLIFVTAAVGTLLSSSYV
jgi:hypothetical protein